MPVSRTITGRVIAEGVSILRNDVQEREFERVGGGNFTEAAELPGVLPNYLNRLIRNMNLRPEIWR